VKLPEALGALRERNFARFFAGQAVSLLGDGMVPVALAFGVLELTDSPSALGLVLAARVLPTVVLLLVGGVVADRVSRRQVMIAADIARMLSQGTMGILLIVGTAEVWMLAVLAAAGGAATAFFEPASTGLVPMTVSVARLQQANALQGIARAAGSIAGPAIAGVLVATAGPGVALAVDGGTFAVSAVFLLALHVRTTAAAAHTRFVGELREGWREFRARDWVWGIVLVAALANMLTAGYRVLGPLISEQDLGGRRRVGHDHDGFRGRLVSRRDPDPAATRRPAVGRRRRRRGGLGRSVVLARDPGADGRDRCWGPARRCRGDGLQHALAGIHPGAHPASLALPGERL